MFITQCKSLGRSRQVCREKKGLVCLVTDKQRLLKASLIDHLSSNILCSRKNFLTSKPEMVSPSSYILWKSLSSPCPNHSLTCTILRVYLPSKQPNGRAYWLILLCVLPTIYHSSVMQSRYLDSVLNFYCYSLQCTQSSTKGILAVQANLSCSSLNEAKHNFK